MYFVARGLAPVGARSGPKIGARVYRGERISLFTTAAPERGPADGGKPPRHRSCVDFQTLALTSLRFTNPSSASLKLNALSPINRCHTPPSNALTPWQPKSFS